MKLTVDFRILPSKIIRASILLVLSTDSKVPQQSLPDSFGELGTISAKDPIGLDPRAHGPGPVENARRAEPLQLRNAAIRCRSPTKSPGVPATLSRFPEPRSN